MSTWLAGSQRLDRISGRLKSVQSRTRTSVWRLRGRMPNDPGPGLRILFYHRIADDRDDPLAVPCALFEAEMAFLADRGYRVLDVVDALDRLYAGELPPRTIALTFDDGYLDNATNAMPVMERYGFRGTVFVVTDLAAGKGTFLAGHGSAAPLLGWEEIERLDGRSPLTFEPHSVTHPNLTTIPDGECRDEILQSGRALEARLGRSASAFCYPGGFVGAREIEHVKSGGYRYGITTEPGVNTADTDKSLVRRTEMSHRDRLVDFASKLGGSHDTPLLGRRLYRRLKYGAVDPGRYRPRPTFGGASTTAIAAPRDRVAYTAVIPTKDRPVHIVAALRQLLAQSRRPERIVVVDASTPALVLPGEVLEESERLGVELELVYGRPSTSGQRNLGVQHVETPVVFFLDDDVRIGETYVEQLLRPWEEHGLLAYGGVSGSRIRDTETPLSKLFRVLFMLHYTDQSGARTTMRRSRKLRYVDRPPHDVVIPAVGAGAVAFRTELMRRQPFNERFPGYALGEDLELSTRIAAEAPLLQVAEALYSEEPAAGGRDFALEWYFRGRRETYFRLLHLDRSLLSVAAFSMSLVGETCAAGYASLRDRRPSHLFRFVKGVVEAIVEARVVRRDARP